MYKYIIIAVALIYYKWYVVNTVTVSVKMYYDYVLMKIYIYDYGREPVASYIAQSSAIYEKGRLIP